MSPRQLRKAIIEGRWISTETAKTLPDPPPEWSEWRQKRMAVAIQCARLFIFFGYTWKEIQDRVNQTNGDRPGFVGEDLSRQRISQYTSKGCDFLLDRGVFVPKPEAREADLAPQKPKQKHRQSKPTR